MYQSVSITVVQKQIEDNYFESLYALYSESTSDLLIVAPPEKNNYPNQKHCKKEISELLKLSKSSSRALLFATPYPIDNVWYFCAILLDQGVLNIVSACNVSEESNPYAYFSGSIDPFVFRESLRIYVCLGLFDCTSCPTDIDIFIVLNMNPLHEKYGRSRVMNVARCGSYPCVYVSNFGRRGETLYEGGSFYIDPTRSLCKILPSWAPGSFLIRAEVSPETPCSLDVHDDPIPLSSWLPPSAIESLYCSLVWGIQDYMNKHQLNHVHLGLSGGIDSALTACLAVDALGTSRVMCYLLPGLYTTNTTYTTGQEIARRLSLESKEYSITSTVQNLQESFSLLEDTLPHQNIQARIRSLFLMTCGDITQSVLLNTSNKSERLSGYSTLYGDSCGTLSPFKFVYKTKIYDLARWRNSLSLETIESLQLKGPSEPLPENIFTISPSAELKPNQKDSDDLPPYEVLDDLLYLLSDLDLSPSAIKDYDEDLVNFVHQRLVQSAHKRIQSPLGFFLSPADPLRQKKDLHLL